MAIIEIRRLFPRDWEPSEPLVAYNNADRRVVVASAMRRGGGSYYDRYGYLGSQDIVCIDCKEAGRDVPVILVEAETRCVHFHHKAGDIPDGLGRHGETAEHLHGKQLIMDWASDQHHILPWSVQDEVWVPGVRLRSDVKAELIGGLQLAFEVQRKPTEWKDWDRRHGGYGRSGVLDVWLWSPDVPHLVPDLPLTSVVLDMEHESIGVLVAIYDGEYRHPTTEGHLRSPTHYPSAPLSEWGISASRSLVPPPAMDEYVADKPEPARWPSSGHSGKQRRGRQRHRGSRRAPRPTTTGTAPAGGAPANASSSGSTRRLHASSAGKARRRKSERGIAVDRNPLEPAAALSLLRRRAFDAG